MIGNYILEHFHPVVAEASFSGVDLDPRQKDIGVKYSKPMPNYFEEAAAQA